MDKQYFMTHTSQFKTTTSSRRCKNGFIQLRSISYNKRQDEEDKEFDSIFKPDTFERRNMSTQYHWIKKPKFSNQSFHKMRQTYQSWYSASKNLEMRKTQTQGNFLESSKQSNFGLKSIRNPKKIGRLGYQSTDCFTKLPDWPTVENKLSKQEKRTDSSHETSRDPYFLNFIRDDIVKAMPSFYKQHDNMMPEHFEREKVTGVWKENKIRTSYRYIMEEKPENYERPGCFIGVFEKPDPAIAFIMDYINKLKKAMEDQRRIKEEMKKDIKHMEGQVKEGLDDFSVGVVKQIQKYWQLLRVDHLNHQSYKMDLHKQIQALKRNKLELIESVKIENDRVLKVEDDLFKCEMFRVRNQMDPKGKQAFHNKILRKQQSSLPVYDDIVG